MSSSIDGSKQKVETTHAEPDFPELKVTDSNFELALVEEPPEELKTAPNRASAPAQPDKPNAQKNSRREPLPPVGWGLVSGLATVFFASATAANFPYYSYTGSSCFLVFGIIAFCAAGLHFTWFNNSLRKLRSRTEQLLPACQSSSAQNWLLTLLPLSWAALSVITVLRSTYATVSPILTVLPWLFLFSVIYWFASMWRWPFQLGKIGATERRAIFWDKSKSFDVKIHAALVEISRYANPVITLPLSLFFLGAPTIWSWKNAIENADPGNKSARQNELASDKNRLVIRYRTFAATERWLRQRLTSNAGNRWKNGLIAFTSIVLFFGVGSALIAVISPIMAQHMEWLQAFFKDARNSVAAPGALNALYNAIVIKTIAGVALLFAAAAAYVYSKQPTHFEFDEQGFRSFTWRKGTKTPRQQVSWSAVSDVRLLQNTKKTQVDDMEIEFVRKSDRTVRLKLGSIESTDDRETILHAIERWAPHVRRDAHLVQALQPPVDQSYTELWLQALSAPPKRDRLNPLTENTTLAEHRYRIRRALGVGGQGAAYEAYDEKTESLVVLKEFLLPIYVDVSVRKEVLERFEGEARILKNLNHPQIVRLEDYFVEDHRAYLVLEHIDGLNLRDTVAKEGPLSEEKVKGLCKQMCSILTYLHEQEPAVVHRDFTPENLILRKDGTLKLIDFNVARQVESTVTSSVVGKPAYLPPEQFRGSPVPQSDIYGMGATLAFLVTGKDPEPINVAHPRESGAAISTNMDKLVARATAIEVRDRYQNCAEILHDLDYELEEQQRTEPPAEEPVPVQFNSSPEVSSAKPSFAEATEDSVTLKEHSGPAELITEEPTDGQNKSRPAKEESPLAHSASKAGGVLAWLMVAIVTMLAVVPDSIWLFDPRAEQHRLELQVTNSRMERDDAATLKLCDQLLSVNPENPIGHFTKGEVAYGPWSGRHPNLPTAITEFGKAAAADAHNKYYWIWYAQSLAQAKRWNECAAAMEKACNATDISLPQLRSGFTAAIAPDIYRRFQAQLEELRGIAQDNAKGASRPFTVSRFD